MIEAMGQYLTDGINRRMLQQVSNRFHDNSA